MRRDVKTAPRSSSNADSGVARLHRWRSAPLGVLQHAQGGRPPPQRWLLRRPDQSLALARLSLVQHTITEVVDVAIDVTWPSPKRGRHVEHRRERRRRCFHLSRRGGLQKIGQTIPGGAFDQNVFTQVHSSPGQRVCKEMTNCDHAGRVVETAPQTRSECFIAERRVPLWNRRRVDPDDLAASGRRSRARHRRDRRSIRALGPTSLVSFGRQARSRSDRGSTR